MDITAVIIAIAGLIGTASSPMIASRLTAKNDRNAGLRNLRTVLYTEATIYAQAVEAKLDHITTQYSTWRKGPELTHAVALTARMRLIAPDDIDAAWKALIDGEELLRWTIEQDYPQLGEDPDFAIPDNNPEIVKLRYSIEHFYAVTRANAIS